jgi:hypothetical protein
MDVKFTFSTFYSHIMKRTTTCITWRGVFSLLNNSERMLVIFICESYSLVNAWILSKNTSGMSSELTFYTGIEPVIRMLPFFFTN